MKIQYDFSFYLWETWPYARKQDIFFVFLIPNLYIYSIKIQTNIKQKFDRKICGKVIDFSKAFLEIFWNGLDTTQSFWFGSDLVRPMNNGSPLFTCNVNSRDEGIKQKKKEEREGWPADNVDGAGGSRWRCYGSRRYFQWWRERPERQVIVLLFSPVFLLSLLLCFSFFHAPLRSSVFLMFLLSFPLCYLFSFPKFLFCSFLYYFINSNLSLFAHLPFFLSLFISVFQNNLPSLFFCLFPPLFLLFQNLPPLSPSLH